YKAPSDFKMQCERLLEVATLSGGVKAKGPTKAKPLDTTPKVKDRAKTFTPDPEKPVQEKPVQEKPAAKAPVRAGIAKATAR
ncbi:MAG: hypothetical protein NXI03_08730, partial [Alphaproteobacteria bacterium]|nr:hypothetical protein [Alphaproteobacteria bacterium]